MLLAKENTLTLYDFFLEEIIILLIKGIEKK